MKPKEHDPLAQGLGNLAEGVALVDRNAPELVWHYTNQAGLIGVLTSGEIWATDTAFLNDASEIRYAQELMVDAAVSEMHRRDGAALRIVLREQVEHPLARTVVACFCEEGDLLSQWRGYASPGGFAIGFDARALARRWMVGKLGAFFPVNYDSEKTSARAQQWAKGVADEWKAAFDGGLRETIGDKVDNDQELLDSVAKRLRQFDSAIGHLSIAAAFHKHPSFAEEREWRFVRVTNGDSSNIGVRPGQSGLVPYERVPFQDSPGDSPIRSIRLGPGLDHVRQKVAAGVLLRSLGYSDGISISESRAPYRP